MPIYSLPLEAFVLWSQLAGSCVAVEQPANVKPTQIQILERGSGQLPFGSKELHPNHDHESSSTASAMYVAPDLSRLALVSTSTGAAPFTTDSRSGLAWRLVD